MWNVQRKMTAREQDGLDELTAAKTVAEAEMPEETEATDSSECCGGNTLMATGTESTARIRERARLRAGAPSSYDARKAQQGVKKRTGNL